MRLHALAKVNLALDVLSKRPDGYHDVRMIMQTISMYDELKLDIRKEPGIVLKTNLPYVPSDSRNLAYRAAEMLINEFDIKEGIEIGLTKYIPVSAGLAGGSSDAAAVLFGMNRLFELGLSMEELMKRGTALGADVPYCIMRGTALAEGIGEKLTPLPSVPACYVLVGKPGISVSTKQAYESLRIGDITDRPDIDGMIDSIHKGDLGGITGRMKNVFQPGVSERYPVINEIVSLMEEHGAMKAMMSGSGPSVFGIFEKRKDAEKAADALRESRKAKTVHVAHAFRVTN
ncbi:MAG: 4-(cytidine 5'-diphospho)-2-C-methyl-D-erythritol kinase [Blautia sp.]|nr:4-(cytidine 5'-diphospho)-2-C-methyl-D-erythritol kinase [Blautia sp.]